MKIKVLTIDEKVKTLDVTKEEVEEIVKELAGVKCYMSEYKTVKGEIITDTDIVSIEE